MGIGGYKKLRCPGGGRLEVMEEGEEAGSSKRLA